LSSRPLSAAVGSDGRPLAQLAGARAVGIAGAVIKCNVRLCSATSFYSTPAVSHKVPRPLNGVAAACPDGHDVYFENVGGPIWNAFLPLLHRYARVPVCD